MFVDHQFFLVYVSFFMKHLCRNPIGRLEKFLAKIDLLKNLFDNISASHISGIKGGNEFVLDVSGSIHQRGDGHFFGLQKFGQSCHITPADGITVSGPGVKIFRAGSVFNQGEQQIDDQKCQIPVIVETAALFDSGKIGQGKQRIGETLPRTCTVEKQSGRLSYRLSIGP